MNKTTQVPTEWLEELISINTNRINAKVNQEKDMYLILTGELEAHIKASKYFQQPEPESLDVDLEELVDGMELLRFFCQKYWLTPDQIKTRDEFSKTENATFSEVLEAFKKSKG
jgi:dimeric dUTPase (all-alpha-NTP-PPase superfamily)